MKAIKLQAVVEQVVSNNCFIWRFGWFWLVLVFIFLNDFFLNLIAISSGNSQYVGPSNLSKGEVLVLVPKQLLQLLLTCNLNKFNIGSPFCETAKGADGNLGFSILSYFLFLACLSLSAFSIYLWADFTTSFLLFFSHISKLTACLSDKRGGVVYFGWFGD